MNILDHKFAVTGAAIVLGAATLATAPALAEYPEKPITMLVGSRPGGTMDSSSRIMAKFLAEELGQPIVVRNKPGGGGSIAAATLKKAKPDGYTLSFAFSVHYTLNPNFRKKTPYKLGDFTYVASTARPQFALVSQAPKPWTDLKSMMASFKASGKPVRVAVPSSLGRMIATAVSKHYGVPFKIVQVKGGGSAVNKNLLGGHTDLAWGGGSHIQFEKANKMLTVVAVGNQRNLASPNAPTLKELGIEVAAPAVMILVAPKGTAGAVTGKLFAAIKSATAKPALADLLGNRLNMAIDVRGPEKIAAYMRAEDANYRKLVALTKGAGGAKKK